MIIKKKMSNSKRSASAWISPTSGINFGVTDYDLRLGYIDSDDNGDAVVIINKKACENANVKIKIVGYC